MMKRLAEFRHDLVGDLLHQGFIDLSGRSRSLTGTRATGGFCVHGDFAGITKFTFLELIQAVIGHAEFFANSNEVTQFIRAVGLWSTDLHGNRYRLTKRVGIFHLPVGILDVVAPADHAVVLHQD